MPGLVVGQGLVRTAIAKAFREVDMQMSVMIIAAEHYYCHFRTQRPEIISGKGQSEQVCLWPAV